MKINCNLLKHFKIKGIQINTNEFISNNTNISIPDLFSNNKFICCEVINRNSIVLPFLVKYEIKKLTKYNIN